MNESTRSLPDTQHRIPMPECTPPKASTAICNREDQYEYTLWVTTFNDVLAHELGNERIEHAMRMAQVCANNAVKHFREFKTGASV